MRNYAAHAPITAQAYYTRSIILRRMGKIEQAQADEVRAMKLDPDYANLTRR